jgi:amino acid transporter
MRNISLIGAISIGIGGMVGGGIFAVLGEAVSLAHGATALAFFIAGIVAILTAYSYAKLSVTYQSEGGTVTFIDNAFGDNILSGSINLMLWLCYIVTISLYSTAFASFGVIFLALAILLVYTYKSNPNAIMIFMLFIIISLLFELIYGRFVRGHLFKREY